MAPTATGIFTGRNNSRHLMTSPSTPSKKPFLKNWQRWLLITILVCAVLVGGGNLLMRALVNAQWHSVASRVRSDLRSVATAIEIYQMDHHALPAWSADPDKSAFIQATAKSETELRAVSTFAHYDKAGNPLATLTTPVSIITSHFHDPFSSMRSAPYAYWGFEGASDTAEMASGWIIWSRGVDTHHDITLELLRSLHDKHGPALLSHPTLIEKMYDPTNGGISNGDICMTSVIRESQTTSAK